MKCTLCKKDINNYTIEFNHLKIDETNSIDICQDCLEKLVNWQKTNYAKLFPTKTLKKIYKKN